MPGLRAWLDRPPADPEELTRYYSETYEAYDEKHGAEGDDAAVIARAKGEGEFRHIPLPTGKRVLDFGCGGGYFLGICRKLGAMVQGIEPSPHGAALTRRQGIPVFEGSLEEYLATHGSERFDIITSNHVIEHVPDPVATLAGLRQLLAPDGMMTIAVPNASSTFRLAARRGVAQHRPSVSPSPVLGPEPVPCRDQGRSVGQRAWHDLASRCDRAFDPAPAEAALDGAAADQPASPVAWCRQACCKAAGREQMR
jgi:2-polyprenyl-3-methyl-5-hydroxy-6-metoxy-1,4-benzoquinol methylase